MLALSLALIRRFGPIRVFVICCKHKIEQAYIGRMEVHKINKENCVRGIEDIWKFKVGQSLRISKFLRIRRFVLLLILLAMIKLSRGRGCPVVETLLQTEEELFSTV